MTTGSSKHNSHKYESVLHISLFVRKGCYIYVCGKIQMAEAVEKTLLEILKHIGNLDSETAQEKFDSMRRNLRYQEDIFG